MKLNAYVAKGGICSRRKAAVFIKQGKVKVNNKVSRDPSYEVKDNDIIAVDSKTIELQKNVYIIFNKPKGVTSTLKDRFAVKKVTDFIPKALGRLYPVGRLDKDSRGLMILTNDGELCYKLTHPKHQIEKEYTAWIEGIPGEEDLKKILNGLKDEGDILKAKKVFIETTEKDKAKIRIVIHEGKKRHIRRLFDRLGFRVLDLMRLRIGNLSLSDLKEGSFKVIDKKSIYNAMLTYRGK